MFLKEGGGIWLSIKSDGNLRYCQTDLETLRQRLRKKRKKSRPWINCYAVL